MHCGYGVVPAAFGSNGRRYIAAFARSGNYRKLPQPGNSFDLAHANFDGKGDTKPKCAADFRRGEALLGRNRERLRRHRGTENGFGEGLGASHTAVGYNGVLLSDVQTGQIDIGRFSTDNVNSITLNQAQSDQIFQPARFFSAASVLHIHSRIPSFEQGDNTHGKVSLKTGSFGLVNPAFYLEQKIGDRLAASFSGEWLSADGKYPYVLHYGPSKNDSTSVEKRKNTDVQHLRLEGAAYGKISQTSRANVRLYYYRSERGLPVPPSFTIPTMLRSSAFGTKRFRTSALPERFFRNMGNPSQRQIQLRVSALPRSHLSQFRRQTRELLPTA